MKENKVIDDWVDRDAVRALAEKLLIPPGGGAKPLDDSVYGETFEGFVDPVPAQEVAEPPKVVQEKKSETVRQEAGASPPPVAETLQGNPFHKKESGEKREGGAGKTGGTASPFRAARPVRTEVKVPEGAKEGVSSLSAFVSWLRSEIPLEKAVILDGDGEVLFDDLRNDKLTSVAKMLARAAHQKEKKSSPAMVVKVGPKRVLQVIPFSGAGGPSFAALILPRPLADGGVTAFVKALKKALS